MPMELSEDPLRHALITDRTPWREVSCPAQLGSTNAAALADPRPWRVVTTPHQTHGRGRHTRSWESPAGASVAVSFTVPLAKDPASWGWLSLIAGLGVTRALGRVTGSPDSFALKWPNDVLAREPHGRWGKVCGILCEATPATDSGIAVAVIGIGVNLDLSPEELPVPAATSLTLAGHERHAPADVVVALAHEIADLHGPWYAGGLTLDELRRDYRAACTTIGCDVQVHLPDGIVVEGEAVDVSRGGEIVVMIDGARRSFAAGDVIHLRRATPTRPTSQA
ncbi:Bifunctional ligase/repressor BirA [Austwickia sp. TVS 96-490-7B]|uniref:biotin--[acetyl-CoA-carboxylase] ligase n=1 Tax=Austwickia sp. TVS 96-490-7B TaxID=2830843 RepID=UPI001D83F66E|nr:biotin--[acetyl-CoA-carboxylase] ligase [Austwickia sp. TVS 96-490-7B]MBW3085374.1 Bifunctional ligase/repressor BirA [Austwickia sp. TVS 96-490-7B]